MDRNKMRCEGKQMDDNMGILNTHTTEFQSDLHSNATPFSQTSHPGPDPIQPVDHAVNIATSISINPSTNHTNSTHSNTQEPTTRLPSSSESHPGYNVKYSHSNNHTMHPSHCIGQTSIPTNQSQQHIDPTKMEHGRIGGGDAIPHHSSRIPSSTASISNMSITSFRPSGAGAAPVAGGGGGSVLSTMQHYPNIPQIAIHQQQQQIHNERNNIPSSAASFSALSQSSNSSASFPFMYTAIGRSHLLVAPSVHPSTFTTLSRAPTGTSIGAMSSTHRPPRSLHSAQSQTSPTPSLRQVPIQQQQQHHHHHQQQQQQQQQQQTQALRPSSPKPIASTITSSSMVPPDTVNTHVHTPTPNASQSSHHLKPVMMQQQNTIAIGNDVPTSDTSTNDPSITSATRPNPVVSPRVLHKTMKLNSSSMGRLPVKSTQHVYHTPSHDVLNQNPSSEAIHTHNSSHHIAQRCNYQDELSEHRYGSIDSQSNGSNVPVIIPIASSIGGRADCHQGDNTTLNHSHNAVQMPCAYVNGGNDSEEFTPSIAEELGCEAPNNNMDTSKHTKKRDGLPILSRFSSCHTNHTTASCPVRISYPTEPSHYTTSPCGDDGDDDDDDDGDGDDDGNNDDDIRCNENKNANTKQIPMTIHNRPPVTHKATAKAATPQHSKQQHKKKSISRSNGGRSSHHHQTMDPHSQSPSTSLTHHFADNTHSSRRNMALSQHGLCRASGAPGGVPAQPNELHVGGSGVYSIPCIGPSARSHTTISIGEPHIPLFRTPHVNDGGHMIGNNTNNNNNNTKTHTTEDELTPNGPGAKVDIPSTHGSPLVFAPKTIGSKRFTHHIGQLGDGNESDSDSICGQGPLDMLLHHQAMFGHRNNPPYSPQHDSLFSNSPTPPPPDCDDCERGCEHERERFPLQSAYHSTSPKLEMYTLSSARHHASRQHLNLVNPPSGTPGIHDAGMQPPPPRTVVVGAVIGAGDHRSRTEKLEPRTLGKERKSMGAVMGYTPTKSNIHHVPTLSYLHANTGSQHVGGGSSYNTSTTHPHHHSSHLLSDARPQPHDNGHGVDSNHNKQHHHHHHPCGLVSHINDSSTNTPIADPIVLDVTGSLHPSLHPNDNAAETKPSSKAVFNIAKGIKTTLLPPIPLESIAVLPPPKALSFERSLPLTQSDDHRVFGVTTRSLAATTNTTTSRSTHTNPHTHVHPSANPVINITHSSEKHPHPHPQLEPQLSYDSITTSGHYRITTAVSESDHQRVIVEHTLFHFNRRERQLPFPQRWADVRAIEAISTTYTHPSSTTSSRMSPSASFHHKLVPNTSIAVSSSSSTAGCHRTSATLSLSITFRPDHPATASIPLQEDTIMFTHAGGSRVSGGGGGGGGNDSGHGLMMRGSGNGCAVGAVGERQFASFYSETLPGPSPANALDATTAPLRASFDLSPSPFHASPSLVPASEQSPQLLQRISGSRVTLSSSGAEARNSSTSVAVSSSHKNSTMRNMIKRPSYSKSVHDEPHRTSSSIVNLFRNDSGDTIHSTNTNSSSDLVPPPPPPPRSTTAAGVSKTALGSVTSTICPSSSSSSKIISKTTQKASLEHHPSAHQTTHHTNEDPDESPPPPPPSHPPPPPPSQAQSQQYTSSVPATGVTTHVPSFIRTVSSTGISVLSASSSHSTLHHHALSSSILSDSWCPSPPLQQSYCDVDDDLCIAIFPINIHSSKSSGSICGTVSPHHSSARSSRVLQHHTNTHGDGSNSNHDDGQGNDNDNGNNNENGDDDSHDGDDSGVSFIPYGAIIRSYKNKYQYLHPHASIETTVGGGEHLGAVHMNTDSPRAA